MKVAKKSVDGRAAALNGLGTAAGGHFVVTAMNRFGMTGAPPKGLEGAVVADETPKRARGSRNPVPDGIGPFAFDMLRRAAAIADGNAFYGDRGETGIDDMSLQYDGEAAKAVETLDGLNVVADDLVTAAFLGDSAQRLKPGRRMPTREESADALARIALRFLLDLHADPNREVVDEIAKLRIEMFTQSLNRLAEKAMGR